MCFPCSFMLEREREREQILHLASLFRCPPLASFGCSSSFWCLMLLMRSGEHARNMDSTLALLGAGGSWHGVLRELTRRQRMAMGETAGTSEIQWDPVRSSQSMDFGKLCVVRVVFLENCPNIDPVWTLYGVTSMCWNSWCASPLTFELMTKYNEIWRHMTK